MPKLKKKNATAKKSHNKENQLPESQRKAPNRPAKLRSWSNQSMLGGHGSSEDRFYGSEQSCFGTQCSTNNLMCNVLCVLCYKCVKTTHF